MKNFLTKIVYFIFPFILLVFFLDFVISYNLKQNTEYPGEIEIWNYIYGKEKFCDVAIYGSSRAWVHIDPKIISDSLNLSVYNFGIDGHNFWLQHLRHIEILRNNKKPKKIILSVDVFSLEKKSELYESDQFLPFMLWNKNIYDYTNSYIGYDKLDYFIPLLRYAGKGNALEKSFKSLVNLSPKEKYRHNGFLGMDRVWNSDFENANASDNFYEIKLDAKSIKLFEKFIKECKSLGIDLVLVYTPEYIDGQKFVKNRSEIFNIYNSMSKKYNLTFYDYSNDSICFNKSLFYNASHINMYGAAIFTKDFASKLKAQKK